MKLFILSTILIFTFASVNLFGADRVKILFKKGGQISGEFIDSIPGVSVKIKPDDFPETVYEMSDIVNIVNIVNFSTLYKTRGVYGFGLGVQYGVLGGGVEMHLPPAQSSVFVGLGTSILAGMGWSLGARFYIRDFMASFQPRFTALYGTNSVLIIKKTDSKSDFELGTGIDIGAGFKWMFGDTHSWGIDFDIYYLGTSSLEERVKELKEQGVAMEQELPKIDLAIGFVFAF